MKDSGLSLIRLRPDLDDLMKERNILRGSWRHSIN